MPDYYVALVKEYLERQDYIVRTEIKYKIREKDKRGILRTNWGDLDILAVKIEDNKIRELIIGEVKAEEQTEGGIQKINEWKFDNQHVKQRLTELIGLSRYKKCLYCWSWKQKTRKTMVLGFIAILS